MPFQFQRKRINRMPETKIMDELEKAAKHFNYIEFGRDDFHKVADISEGVVRKHFGGSWKKAIVALKQHLKQKGLNLSPRSYHPNRILSDKDLFEEMDRIWQKVGQRPSQAEWEMSEPKIAYATYKKRFGGWTNACLKFIEYKMGRNVIIDIPPQKENIQEKVTKLELNKNDKREIPLRLRLNVLNRDNFRCVFCGRSPATNVGVVLHIDHINPFAKGGKTVLENLQTLCFDCNIGKSDRKLK